MKAQWSLPRALLLTLAISAAVLGAGCEVGPHYREPQPDAPADFADLPASPEEAPLSMVRSDSADLARWWTQFHDPELESLIKRALRSNLDLQTAASRIRQAREQEIIAGGARLPSISASGNAVHLHSNSNPLAGLAGGSGASPGSSTGAGAASGGPGTSLSLYSAGFDATWEVDFFGAAERVREAAKADTEAALWQLRDAQVSLSAEVASGYLALRTAQTRSAIIQQSVHHQTELLDLATARARAGLVTELDVNQQRTQLAATAAQLPGLEAEQRARVHALGVLLGLEPETLRMELSTAAAPPLVPAALPIGLPSELLRRRPDVRHAERQLAAATADVGVAVASLYPKFNLIGAVTQASSSAGNLLAGRSFTDVGLGMISWPLFQGGRLRANVQVSEERQNQAYLVYRKSVLSALQDGEDALARYTSEQRRLVSLRESQRAAASSAHIAEQQYRAGLVTFINVLTATTTWLSAEDQVQQSDEALAQDLVSLYKALGGGWEDEAAPR